MNKFSLFYFIDSSSGHYCVIIRACTENYLVAKIKATKAVQISSKATKNIEQRERTVGNGDR